MNRDQVIVKTSVIGILGNIVLVSFKIFIGILVGSIAIILDAVNNLTDAISSVITIVGTKLANKKPDHKHPFGYGRIEYMTSLIIAVIVLIAGATAIRESITSIIDIFQGGQAPSYTLVSLIIVSGAIVVKVLLGLYFRAQAKKVNSDALKASGTDALMDSILSLSTLIAGIICMTTGVAIEGWLGVIIGCFIIKSGFEILLDAIQDIIGRRSDPEFTKEIKQAITKLPQVKGAYDLILNNYGPNKIIGTVHVEVDDHMTAKEIHVLTRVIQELCSRKFNIIMTVGVYASNDSDEVSHQLKEDLLSIVAKHEEIIQMHGFYVDFKNNLVSFDLIFSFKVEHPEEAKKKVIEEMRALHPDYHYYVNIDVYYTN
jgi:cation diffusion facilitator family transporter